MEFHALPTHPRAVRINRRVEAAANRALRAIDRAKARVGLRGRAADYDDERYEFVGGARDRMRKKHYDKSLRLLWKAETNLPWSSFRDASEVEKHLREVALSNLSPDERAAHDRITSDDFRALVDREYTPRQKQAIVNILTAIGHGEAYAWLVSASTLRDVKSTGAKAAVTMQIVEEAKHFVVMRELVRAFGVPVPRQSAWEYLMLERILKARGLDKFFGMNVLVETIALSIFGALAHLPGLDILRLFHLDESRHTALPSNYFKEFPLHAWHKRNPVARVRRLRMALPALPLILLMEEDLAELGIDVFDFAGSVMRKVAILSERSGFDLPVSSERLLGAFNAVFNAYAKLTRPGHRWKNYMVADTSVDDAVAAVERPIFGAAA
ncbi:MAG: hypothetical protein D6689_16730 [Deltaproteobacteria bacterium]|nr:MAG: hypothetical protein D6689_16730 [Deltaproteobacteria bacterium]